MIVILVSKEVLLPEMSEYLVLPIQIRLKESELEL